ncbi:Tim44-like domain [Sesbania bispinosa]|nr:Tim44-like domain [Sesbania bispinosa]
MSIINPEFQQSVKELKEKADELKGVKEELKEKTKQKTEQLYKHVDEVWTEAEAAAKKVSHNVKEKISAATEEVKETFGIGKQDSSAKQDANAKQGSQTLPEEEQNQKFESSNAAESLFGKFKSTISSSNVSTAFQKLKEAKLVNVTKKGYDIIKEELSSKPTKRRRVPFTSSGETSTRTELVVMPSKQSWWSKKFDEFREKVKGHPVSKRFIKFSDPVKTKGQEEAIKPVLNAYIKGDVETLKKYCSPELIERCKAEHNAYQSHGIFFDNKILHVSEVEVRETKMMGSSPVIIVMFQTQQIHCVRDRNGSITEGGKDTIHTVYYFWALQQMDQEDHGEDGIYLMWRLREMQQQGIQALI